MSDVTRILSQIEQGEPQAADKLTSMASYELQTLSTFKK
jgi:hypothetical protein